MSIRFFLIIGTVECEIPFSHLRKEDEFKVMDSDGKYVSNGEVFIATSDPNMWEKSIRYIERKLLN